MGCGACATVCPSGAMTYAYPAPSDLGARLRTLLGEYARAGGRDAALLLHAADAEPSLAALARRGRGLPARVLPVEVEHIASVGIDLWMAALAWGASGVAVLATGREAPQYREALRFQMSIAQTVANAQGYQGEHFRLIDAGTDDVERAVWEWPVALPPRVPATFAATNDKRRTLAFAFDHLAQHAPVPRTTIALPAGAPFGALDVDKSPLHDVPRVRRLVSRSGAARSRREPAAALHRDELRAVRDLREARAPSRRSRSCHGSTCRRRRVRPAC